MKTSFDCGTGGVTIPANTSSATFIPGGDWRPSTGLQTARSRSEMRVAIGTPEAQPAVEFCNAWDGTPVAVGVGTNVTANGTSPTAASATDIAASAAQYLLCRPGWLVRNTPASNSASCWLDGVIEAWGD